MNTPSEPSASSPPGGDQEGNIVYLRAVSAVLSTLLVAGLVTQCGTTLRKNGLVAELDSSGRSVTATIISIEPSGAVWGRPQNRRISYRYQTDQGTPIEAVDVLRLTNEQAAAYRPGAALPVAYTAEVPPRSSISIASLKADVRGGLVVLAICIILIPILLVFALRPPQMAVDRMRHLRSQTLFSKRDVRR